MSRRSRESETQERHVLAHLIEMLVFKQASTSTVGTSSPCDFAELAKKEAPRRDWGSLDPESESEAKVDAMP